MLERETSYVTQAECLLTLALQIASAKASATPDNLIKAEELEKKYNDIKKFFYSQSPI